MAESPMRRANVPIVLVSPFASSNTSRRFRDAVCSVPLANDSSDAESLPLGVKATRRRATRSRPEGNAVRITSPQLDIVWPATERVSANNTGDINGSGSRQSWSNWIFPGARPRGGCVRVATTIPVSWRPETFTRTREPGITKEVACSGIRYVNGLATGNGTATSA